MGCRSIAVPSNVLRIHPAPISVYTFCAVLTMWHAAIPHEFTICFSFSISCVSSRIFLSSVASLKPRHAMTAVGIPIAATIRGVRTYITQLYVVNRFSTFWVLRLLCSLSLFFGDSDLCFEFLLKGSNIRLSSLLTAAISALSSFLTAAISVLSSCSRVAISVLSSALTALTSALTSSLTINRILLRSASVSWAVLATRSHKRILKGREWFSSDVSSAYNRKLLTVVVSTGSSRVPGWIV